MNQDQVPLRYQIRLVNNQQDKLEVQLEPWGDIVDLAPNRAMLVSIHAESAGKLEIHCEKSVLVLWGWETIPFDIEIEPE